ncbi:MAG: serine/threonine-protein kinase [Cyanobacteria bacterium]|nr:serine/threonine-protein kinase [Cyanobacteriota bacterium]
MAKQILGGRYRILYHLGGGGFGQTYLAEDRHLPGQPRCVVKRLQPRTTDAVSLESARRLFDAEADALYQLGSHDQIPMLLAHFEENAHFYLVQEYVEGTLLTEEVRPGQQLSEDRVIDLLQDLLGTLCSVHEQQVIHRDIKPSNLIRRHSDRKVVLIDFGAVKQVSSQPLEMNGQVSITVAIGSLGYMPNEQLAGQPTLNSDIYAIGMLALQALTGLEPKRLPKDPRTSEIMWRELVSVKPALADIIDKMVRYDFRQRYPSAVEAFTALNTLNPSRSSSGPGLTLGQTGPSTPSDPSGDPSGGYLTWLERADELFQQSQFADAVRWYTKVVQIQPSDLTAWFSWAMAQENLNHYEAALTAYDRVLQHQPDDYLAWLKRGKVLENLQRFEGALAAYDEVLRLQPDNYWTWNDRGQILEKLNQLETAITSYNRAVQLKPDFQLALGNRKRLLVALKRVEELYTLNHYGDAIAACDQAIADNPNDANAWLLRGMALESLRHLPEAALSYNRVVQLHPQDHVTWFKLGCILDTLKRPQPATVAFSNVVRLQPKNHWAWHQWGCMLEKTQKLKEAISAYQQALTLKPDFQIARDAHQRVLSEAMTSIQAPQPSQQKQQHPSNTNALTATPPPVSPPQSPKTSD